MDTLTVLSPAGYLINYSVVGLGNGSVSNTSGGVSVSQLLPGGGVQAQGVGEHALNSRLSGRHGTMLVNATAGATGSARAVAFIAVSPTILLGVALDNSNRPYALLLDLYGTTVGQSEVGAAVPVGEPLTVQLAWDAENLVYNGLHAGVQSNNQVLDWTTLPSAPWTPFIPTVLYVGTSLNGLGLGDFNGTISRVQVGDTVVFVPIPGAAVSEDLSASATLAGVSTLAAAATVAYEGGAAMVGDSTVVAEADVIPP